MPSSSISPEWSLFAGRAVHDLNSLVSKIAFRCETVREEYSEELVGEGQAHLDKALQVCRQVTSLVGSMGRFVDAEAVVGQPRLLDLQAIVPRLHRDVARAYGRFDAVVECGPLPMVKGDREEITYLFMQLFDNAFKFSGDLVPKVTVNSTEKDGRCHIEVCDDGPGIGLVEDRLDMVLEPFVRLDPHGPIPGTGLGLFRCRRIIKRHGGQLVIRHVSDIGGVRHDFSLPLVS